MKTDKDAQDGGKREVVPFHKLFSFADSFDVALMLVGAIGAAVAGAPLPVMAYLFGSTMDALGGHYAKDPQEQLHKMSESSLRCVLVGFIAAVGYFFQISCWTSTGERQADRIRYLYLEALLHQDASFFDQEISTGAAVESMTADAFHIQQATGGKIGKLIQILSTLASGYIVAFTQGWKLTLVISALIPLVMGTGYSMDLMITRTSREAFVATGKAGSIVEQVISAIRTVVAFTGEKKALEAYDTTLKKADRANLRECLASGWGMGAVLFFTFNTYALTLWFGSHLIFQGSYTGGQVITIFFSVIIGTGALGQSSPCLSAFASGTAAAQKIFRVIYRKPTVDINETGLELGELRGQITFKNVKFWYPSRPGQEIFGNLSLDIDAGTTAALVGESGSGKSTVARLIERFYDPQGGEVMVDGVDLRELKLGWWRMQVGLVSQEPVLFNMSVKENIAYGKEGATDEELEAAASVANAAKFIASLPQGYDTNVGNSGLQLSGGQKQRIAIARAVLKNPRVLLLDEATSSLDAESESLVHQALDQIMLHRTTLIIAHRLTTVKKAQFIAVLDRGVIVEKGTHSELLSNPDGVFSQLVRLEERLKNEEVQKEEDEQQAENPSIIAATHRRKRSRASSRSLSFGSMGSIGSIAQNETEKQIQPCRESSENASSNDEMTSSMIQCSHILRLAAHNKPEIPILFVGSVAAGLNGATMPIVGLLFANILQSFYQPRENVPSACLRWIHLFLVVACVSLILTPLQSVCFSIAGEKLVRRIRLLTFDRILHQEISWFDENVNSSGVISSRLLRDASRVRTMVGDSLALVVQNMTTVVVGLFIAFSTCWQLALLFVALLPFFCLDGMMQIKLGEIFDYKAKAMYDETSRVAHESLSSIRTVASFCAEKKVLQFYKSKSENCVRDGVRRAIIGGLGLAITYVVMFGSLSLSFWVGGRLISQGKVDSRGFIKTFLAIELSAFAVSLSVALAPDFANVKPAITSVFNMLDLKANDINSGTVLKRLKGEVEFQHVQFHYPSRPDAQIFDDLSFTLRAGQTLALVGESGGGKSTVLALVQRFYEPHAGRILLDKVDIKQLQLKWLRRQMGLVSQEPYLFNDTIQSNIEYGLEGEVSQEEVQRASEIANAHKFISGLPQGYQSIVGEKGIQLSGGQKQRVAIARAMVRDPKIVLLDEATSALDAESELAVQEALERAALGRSTMVVAHRLSTVRNADLIVVLKDGHIAEQGTHEELIGLEHGLYAALVNISTTTIAKTHE